MVALVNDSNGQHCGGALIRSNWVLTAGHCVIDNATGKVIQLQSIHAVIGRTKLSGTGGEVINIKQIILNPSYNNITLDNDLALIELATAASYVPITLIGPSFSNSLIPDGALLTALSWEIALAPNGANSDALMQASIPVVSQNVCQQAYLTTHPTSIPTDNMFCAGNVNGVKGACSGDSGGPIVLQGINGWIQGGITSQGPSPNCGQDIYSTYTRISNYAAWVSQNTCAPSDIPPAPQMSLSVSGNTVTVSWNPVPNAQGYRLYYAPYPYIPSQAEPIYNTDLGSRLSISGTLPAGSAYYVAIHAYNETCYGDWSNIESFTIQ
jgi:secreted trypsin-like serine protease